MEPEDAPEELDFGSEDEAEEPKEPENKTEGDDAPMDDPEPDAGDDDKADKDGAAKEPAEDAKPEPEPLTFDGPDPLTLPPHGTEIYVGGIAKETTEEEVMEVFAPHGEVHGIRLFKDPANEGQNRGYVFVTFKTKEAAAEAIKEKNGTEVKGKKLRVSTSQQKNRLWIGNIPKDMVYVDVEKAVSSAHPGLEKLDMSKEQGAERNRGFAFASYYNQAAAERARKSMIHPSFSLGPKKTPVTVSWAEPRPSDDPDAALQVKAVYVKGAPKEGTEEKLREAFGKFGAIEKVVVPMGREGQRLDFAFVHFVERAHAVAAAGEEGLEVGGKVVEKSLKRPDGAKRGPPGSQGGDRLGPPRLAPPRGAGGGYGGRGGRGGGGMGGYGGGAGAFGGGMPMMMPGGVPGALVPCMLPNGQMAYMMQPAGAPVGGAGMGGGAGPMRGGGGYNDRGYDRGYDRGPPPPPRDYDRGYDRGPPPPPRDYDRGYDRGPPPPRGYDYDRGYDDRRGGGDWGGYRGGRGVRRDGGGYRGGGGDRYHPY